MHYFVDRLKRLSSAARSWGRTPLAFALVALVTFGLTGNAWAVVVSPGSHTFDATLPGSGFVSFDGTNFVTPTIPPNSTLGVSIDGGPLTQNYPLSNLTITSGFAVSNVFVFDVGANGITPGDGIFGSIGPSSFSISNNIGVILTGSFTSASLSSAVSATAGSLSASDVTGLVLTPGPAFTFDTSFVSAIAASPTGFSISLSSIPGGVQVVQSGAPVGPFIPVNLAPMSLSSGSTVVSGTMTVVPEPGTVALLGVGALALVVPAARRWRKR